MTDAQQALAQVREALAAGPTPGPWHAMAKLGPCGSDHGYRQVAVLERRGLCIYAEARNMLQEGRGFVWGPAEVDAAFLAACNPTNIAAILAHVEAQAAEIEELRERCHEYAMALADKEQR